MTAKRDYATIKREFEDAILAGMARTLWLLAYADWVDEDEERKSDLAPKRGGDWDDVAPETPYAAFLAARDLTRLLAQSEGLTKAPLSELYELARTVDDGEPFEFNWGETIGEKSESLEAAEEFGGALAHMAIGTGVSWFDDHREKRGSAVFAPSVPHFEVRYDGDELSWSGAERAASGRKSGAQQARLLEDDQITDPGKIGRITVINAAQEPYDAHSYVFALGAYGDILYLVFGDSLDDAVDQLVNWAADNAPGLLADDQVAEEFERLRAARERSLRRKLDPTNDRDADILNGLQAEAESDTDQFGDGHYLLSYEWQIVAEDPSRADVLRLAMNENPRKNSPGNATSLAAAGGQELQVRARLADRTPDMLCSDGCPGWAVFDTDRGFEIQACDECNVLARSAGLPVVTDEDVEILPEAQQELAIDGDYVENGGKRNPRGLTRKGERMYKAIEKGYRAVGEARAKEIASRTVLSRAKQGGRGLIKKPAAGRR